MRRFLGQAMMGATRRARPLRALAWLLAACMVFALSGCGREEAPSPVTAPAQPVKAEVAPEPVSPAPAPAPAAATVVSVPAIEAPPGQTAACLAHTAATGPTHAIAVHRWVDASGIIHYSDQAPSASAKEHRVIEVQGLPPVSVQASGYDVNLPDQLQQRAVADALGVQRVLRDALGVAGPAGVALHVVFVKDAATYARLIGDPVLATSAGAYSTAQRTIYVRMQAQDEASFAVLRHEITHALVHESIGNLPTSINEGLAEYFGRYRVGGLGGQIDIGADRSAIIGAAPAGDGADALVDLLARDGADFYAADAGASVREQRYLRAYALVALLMRDGPGRAALTAVLSSQRADPCRPVAAENLLDASYPGGLVALAPAWSSFMRAPPQAIQAY